MDDGEEINIGGGRHLTTVHSPGHAKHHLALHDSATGALFVGDAVGVRLPDAGVLRPATPPADFDLDQALDSLRRFADRRPSALALAHYGLLPGDAVEALEDAGARCVNGQALPRRLGTRAETLRRHFGNALAASWTRSSRTSAVRMETLNGLHSNAEGLKLWLAGTGAAAPDDKPA